MLTVNLYGHDGTYLTFKITVFAFRKICQYNFYGLANLYISGVFITVLFGITVLFLFISNFIKYPDALTGKAIILTKEQPEKITVGKTNAGQYFKMYVKEGDTVKQGDTLLVAQNEKTGKVSPAIASLAGKIFIS
ncbi:MAG: hypothetical protein LBE82_02585, partial [Chitinophagaceae bacterium]|nr:hypothetical protein [Chitinophagaceae bacterium]